MSPFVLSELMDPQKQSLYSCRRGQKIPILPEDFWHIERGVIQLQNISSNGKVTVLGWLQEGNFWAKSMTDLSTLEAIALTDCTMGQMTSEDIQSSKTLQQQFVNQTIQKLRQTEHLLAITGLRPIEERLVALILLLKQELGQTKLENTRLRCRLTHKNIAETIGTTRVTVTRLFKEFQDKNWFFFDEDRHLIITNQFPIQ